MFGDLLPAVLLALGVALGFMLAVALYTGELLRMARLLRSRDARSNARVTTSGAAPGLRELAGAINDELDRSAQSHVDALRHQQEFQRDLSALSHDIRTPLTGAKGYLQLAADDASDETLRHNLSAAASRIDATTELLDQLFAYTKSADPDLELDREPVALMPLVENILVGHYPDFEARGWEPSLDFVDPAVCVEGDREAISRIVENLVVNAIRHGAGAPSITQRMVEASQDATSTGGARAGASVALLIANPVANPDSIDAARLFDRFYQADTARGAGGSGLGLSVAANLAHAMGMTIDARIEGANLVVTLTARTVHEARG
ncbi:HAMP domain-containing sensor histidine kinase [Collinsella sp. An2]|uniref:sensor histidine kinase n=1 Tax=Collinsella sp. An2 TaxID=1965585 RepID=UPI000B3A509C|nr:HAMP domain-containing sensor histidine kinase [Collinsella sp. An2]